MASKKRMWQRAAREAAWIGGDPRNSRPVQSAAFVALAWKKGNVVAARAELVKNCKVR